MKINYFPSEVPGPEAVNIVEIKHSLFAENKAHTVASATSLGGGIAFLGTTNPNTCHMLQIQIDSSIFIDNQAADGGGALFMSDSCLKTIISNCTFQITDQMSDSPKGVFVWSLSEISINASVFFRSIKQLSPTLLELDMLSESAVIMQLNMTVKCHKWSELTLESTLTENDAKEMTFRCSFCQPSFYIPSNGEFHMSFLPNETQVLVHGTVHNSAVLKCIPCPPGADCPGNDITAKPNFWGSNTDHVISMHLCPADYCCTENCTGYDQCSGHRTGVLCGSCEEDYSLSMLSSRCIEDAMCNDYWLWPMVTCAVVMYLAWYTFKNDVFGIPTLIARKLCRRSPTESENDDVNYIDKGYFGIVTYFIQVKEVIEISVSFDSERKINTFFNQIQLYIELGLNFELSFFSNDTCTLKGMTATNKMIFRLLFLFGMFLSWNFFFLCLSVIKQFVVQRAVQNLEKLRIKLICGLVEIIKYTYLGFTSIVFQSLTCTSVASNFVWFYDGSVACYSTWQIAMITFCVLNILPYPLFVYFGMKLIYQKRISQRSFFFATYLPLPVVIYWLLFCKQKKDKSPVTSHGQVHIEEVDVEKVIYDGFTGGFRESKHDTLYWEAVLMWRRLLISATILIPNNMIQLCVCLALCLVFQIHHLERKPFSHTVSNKAETFSLSLLCGVAAINLFKAAEINPEGIQVKIVNYLELMEGMFVVLLIMFIFFCEAAFTIAKRRKKAVSKDVKHQPFGQNDKAAEQRQRPAEAGSSASHTEERVELEAVVPDNRVRVEQEAEKERRGEGGQN